MGSRSAQDQPPRPWPRLADVIAVAERQHGVISRTQLLGLGLPGHAIEHRVRTGRLHCLWRGVYALGRPQLSREGWWIGAVLACGDGAALSHGCAAALLAIRDYRGGIEVSVPLPRSVRRPGIVVHRRTTLGPDEITRRAGIPVTRPVQTLVDLASQLDRDPLEAAINRADKLDLIDPESLRRALGRIGPMPGVATLRRTLDRRTFRLTDSALERRFLPIARRVGLPMPVTGAVLNTYRVDFYWPGLRLVVETDGLRYHRTAIQQSRDSRRDQAHLAAGLTPLRFTHAEIAYDPHRVETTLRAVTRVLTARHRG